MYENFTNVNFNLAGLITARLNKYLLPIFQLLTKDKFLNLKFIVFEKVANLNCWEIFVLLKIIALFHLKYQNQSLAENIFQYHM